MDRDEVLRVAAEMEGLSWVGEEFLMDRAARLRAAVGQEQIEAENERLRAAVEGGWRPADQPPALTIRDDKPCELNGRSIPPITYSEDVLVLLDDDSRRIDSAAQFDDRAVAFWRTYSDRVKAWQPLPPPPKEAK